MVSRAFLLALVSSTVVPILAHGGHDQEPLSADTDWATRHLAGINSHVYSYFGSLLIRLRGTPYL